MASLYPVKWNFGNGIFTQRMLITLVILAKISVPEVRTVDALRILEET